MGSLKVRDIAARLNVSEKTVYKWLGAGLIPAARLGRTWVVTEEGLESVLTPASVPHAASAGPHPAADGRAGGSMEASDELATLDRVAAVAAGAIRAGLDGVLAPRRESDETKRAIGEALEEARGEVLLHGIGLREFFGDMDYTPILRRMLTEDRPVRVRAMLVHPLSDYARARAAAEIGTQFGDESAFRAGPLFGDSWRSLNVIAALRRAAADTRAFKIDVRFADHWPSVYFVMTEQCCFIEAYHFGRLLPTLRGASIEGLVPMLRARPDASYYRLLRGHFEYLWGGTNPYIPVQTLEQVADAVKVNV